MDAPWGAVRLVRDFSLSTLDKFAVHDRHPLRAIPCGTRFAAGSGRSRSAEARGRRLPDVLRLPELSRHRARAYPIDNGRCRCRDAWRLPNGKVRWLRIAWPAAYKYNRGQLLRPRHRD